MSEHDFRGTALTPEQYLEELRRALNLTKVSRGWDGLPWAARFALDGLEGKYEQMLEQLKSKGSEG